MAEKIISIVSGKGGVGKTVTALNVGLALGKMKHNTTIVDADITASNLALHLGLTWFPVTLQDVLSGTAEIKDAIYDTHGIKIVPSSLYTGMCFEIVLGFIDEFYQEFNKSCHFSSFWGISQSQV